MAYNLNCKITKRFCNVQYFPSCKSSMTLINLYRLSSCKKKEKKKEVKDPPDVELLLRRRH